MKIIDKVKSTNLGITYFNDRTIQEITTNSGKLAKHNEYQIHYWSLNIRFTFGDNSIIDISIPTVLYNYPQKVSTASIDFSLKDVEDLSNKLSTVHQMEVDKLLPKIKDILDTFPYQYKTVELISTPLNTLHRHP